MTEALAPLPWSSILRWCVGSVVLVVGLVAMAAVRDGGIERVLFAGEDGPAAAAIRRDIPDAALLEDDVGHDGQHYYVLARALPHLEQAKDDLGLRPAYRAQRIGLPLLARVLHPWRGGGRDLVVAMLIANALGILVGAVGVAVLVIARGGPAWAGALFPWLPACVQGLQTSLADAFAVGLALGALAAVERRRPVLAAVLALGALLGKEPTILLFAGWGLWAVITHKGWRMWVPLAAPLVPVIAWLAYLRRTFPGPRQVEEFAAPFTGLVGAVQATVDRVQGATLIGLGTSLLVFAGLVALAAFGDRSSPWPWIALPLVVYQCAFSDVLWYRTIDALRLTSAGAAVLLVVLASRLGRARAPSPT